MVKFVCFFLKKIKKKKKKRKRKRKRKKQFVKISLSIFFPFLQSCKHKTFLFMYIYV